MSFSSTFCVCSSAGLLWSLGDGVGVTQWSPHPWFCFPQFQLAMVNLGLKILKRKFQK